MSLLLPKSARLIVAVLAMLFMSSVYARPIRESGTATQVQPATNIQPRDPRLIPDTERYLPDVFSLLGVPNSIPSETPTPTPTPTISPSVHITAEQDKPVNIKATPTISASKTTQSATYTTNIRHGDTKSSESIQVGSGWTGGKKLQASDLPFIFDSVSKEIDHRFRNLVDSSDERGLGDFGSYLGALGL
ncbi:hypothetical protein PENDEC_c002G06230 [Penicillium decumbens]|uniref:Uncharacterized protein n=1 Tax=Penicillium decumbens TaxID=69771 RepID=A0A1V6PKI4_PENDC|nr:hypothetical protein PENDEC_c002G06230 [Penicillium decumbens]